MAPSAMVLARAYGSTLCMITADVKTYSISAAKSEAAAQQSVNGKAAGSVGFTTAGKPAGHNTAARKRADHNRIGRRNKAAVPAAARRPADRRPAGRKRVERKRDAHKQVGRNRADRCPARSTSDLTPRLHRPGPVAAPWPGRLPKACGLRQ